MCDSQLTALTFWCSFCRSVSFLDVEVLCPRPTGLFYSGPLQSPWALTREEGPGPPYTLIPPKPIWISHPKGQDLPFSEILNSCSFLYLAGLSRSCTGRELSLCSFPLQIPVVPHTPSPRYPQSRAHIPVRLLCSAWDPSPSSPTMQTGASG